MSASISVDGMGFGVVWNVDREMYIQDKLKDNSFLIASIVVFLGLFEVNTTLFLFFSNYSKFNRGL